jgi:hypothetical protein
VSKVWPKIYISLHAKYPVFLSELNETWIFSTDLEKTSNIKFNENLSSGRRVVPCAQTDKHDKANNCFSHFANASKSNLITHTIT